MQQGASPAPEASAPAPKISEDGELLRREHEIKLKELDVREREADKALALAKSSWWRRADPLLLAIIVGILTMFGNMIVAYFNNYATIRQETVRSQNTLAQEKRKARYTLILQAIGTGDQKVAEQNIKFFIDAGLLEDEDQKIARALERFKPVLPPPGTNVRPQPLEVPEIARIYNFPTQFDGSGQAIGLLEFGGGYRPAELAAYFAAAHLPMPQVIDVSVGGGANSPGGEVDAQVALDIEIIGTIAPKAIIRVYFASAFTEQGFVDALHHAVADHVSVISIGWGRPESQYPRSAITAINNALRAAAEKDITVIAAAGDGGVTDNVQDGKPHVDFPASSPWVLAVGGTSVVTSEHQIVSEIVWNEGSVATGGGVSEIFERPDW